jgi:integrase
MMGKPKPEAAPAPENDYTIAEYLDIWYEKYCLGPDVTRPEYHRSQIKNIKRLIGERKLKEFTREDVQEFKTNRFKDGVVASTVNRTTSVLSGMFDYARRVGQIITVSPFEEYEQLPEDSKIPPIPNHDEVERLVGHAVTLDSLVGAYLGFVSETGLREEEALQLERTALRIHSDGSGWLKLDKTKTHTAREVPLSPKAIAWVEDLPVIIGNPYVFVSLERMDRLRCSYMKQIFHAARKLAGIECTVHGLRHYRCTTWLEDGAPVNYVQEWMGHASITTTMRYAHTSKTAANRILREVREKEAERREDGRKEAR